MQWKCTPKVYTTTSGLTWNMARRDPLLVFVMSAVIITLVLATLIFLWVSGMPP